MNEFQRQVDAVKAARAQAVEHVESLSVYRLANLIECVGAVGTAGAKFLTKVRDAVAEEIGTGDPFTFERAAEIATAAPSDDALLRWQQFVDLGAWTVDISSRFLSPEEHGMGSTDMTELAGIALHVIAERLALAIAEEVSEVAFVDR